MRAVIREWNIFSKNKKGSIGMTEPKHLISDYSMLSNKKYLNILADSKKSHAGIEEWLSQTIDKQYPFGVGGLIAVDGVTDNFIFQIEVLLR